MYISRSLSLYIYIYTHSPYTHKFGNQHVMGRPGAFVKEVEDWRRKFTEYFVHMSEAGWALTGVTLF